MSRIMGVVAAVALFAGVSAFAQNSDSSSAPAAPPAAGSGTSAAPSDSANGAAPADSGMHHHHHHHGREARNSSATDHDADKLNACQVSASPTQEQEQCLHQAENAPS